MARTVSSAGSCSLAPSKSRPASRSRRRRCARRSAASMPRYGRTCAIPPSWVVTRSPHHTFQVAVGVQAVLAQDDPGETTGGGVGGVDCQAAPAKIRHGCHIGGAQKPEQRTMGVDAEHFSTDAVGQPRQEGLAQADRRTAAQTLRFPADPVADGDVHAFILVVALLVGNVGDQFLVDTAPCNRPGRWWQGRNSSPNLVTSVAAEPGFNPWQGRR
jgi:hypothetical protein